MWKFLKKRRALKSYKTTLAAKLRKRYGRERHYTPAQVEAAARDSSVSSVFLCYAFAIYCERDTFDAYHRERGESCDYVAMRAEVAPVLGVPAETAATFDTTTWERDPIHYQDGGLVGDFAGSHGDGGDGGGDGGGCGGGCGGGD